MFKRIYKSANDDIKTNRELIDKIFETAEKAPAVRRRPQIFKYGTAVAAVFVFAAAAFMYPQLAKLNEQPQLPVETTEEQGKIEEKPLQEDVLQKSEEETVIPETKTEQQEVTPVIPKVKSQTESPTDIIQPNENEGIAIASESGDAQGFSIPEGPSGRVIDGSGAVELQNAALELLTEVSEEEKMTVEAFLRSTFGEKDEQTENTFIFEVVGKIDGMFLCRWKHWVIDHSSLLTELVISEDLTELFECSYTEDGFVQWNTSNNMLEN